ncbi:MAG: hypothetical protein J6U40_13090 [Kiritimatiellae bacterium]|nr:hypothetical protein [Kiritimatiellia bacterium]
MIRQCVAAGMMVLAGIAIAAPTKQQRPAGTKGKASVPREFQSTPAEKISTQSYAPKRTTPVFTGEFVVDLVLIAFPDCQTVDAQEAVEMLSTIKGHTIQEYYQEYSQGITWPSLRAYSRIVTAPQPLGYSCQHDPFSNRIGFPNQDEGGARAAQLRAAALNDVKKGSYLVGSPSGKTAVTCYVYCKSLDRTKVERLLRGAYPKKPNGSDEIGMYNPPIPWRDPLWPNSLPQIFYPSDAGTLIHELGHVLGAPDFYHASEKYDGLPGDPSLPWAYGPTGPAYCRCIYQAFLPPSAYPTLTQDGTYTLAPRATNPAGDKALGCFIPSTHPNYLFYLEYVKDEKPPIGAFGHEGLLIHVINVTFTSPMMGPPDMCYTYRPDDPYFRARTKDAYAAYFQEGDTFDEHSNPAAILPNLIPGGIAIRNIKFTKAGATFDLTINRPKMSGKELTDSLLPKIELRGVNEVLPTSFRAYADIHYRGEPLNTEYGFCYDTMPKPTIAKKHFPLYHRDRYDARILGLSPGKTYYVRAYIKNANGVTYSETEKSVTLPGLTLPDKVPPLLTDRIRGNFFINRWHFQVFNNVHDTANPILALMSLAAYYRVIPGTGGKNVKGGIDPTRIHTNPSQSRPDFRIADVEALRHQMGRLANEAGLRKKAFDKQWDKNFATKMDIRNAKAAIFTVDDESIRQHERHIREWLALGQPVMLIRQNLIVPPDTGVYYPLDIAIIDGYADSETYHVTFPCGKDRGRRGDGDYPLDKLFEYVEDARLVFYTPVPVAPGTAQPRFADK